MGVLALACAGREGGRAQKGLGFHNLQGRLDCFPKTRLGSLK